MFFDVQKTKAVHEPFKQTHLCCCTCEGYEGSQRRHPALYSPALCRQKCQLKIYVFLLSNKPVFSGEEFDACSMTAVHGVCEWRILINISRVGLHSQLQQYLHTVIFPCCSGPMKRGPDRKTDIMLYNNEKWNLKTQSLVMHEV